MNISTTEIILNTEMSQRSIPIELNETDLNLLPHAENILHTKLAETIVKLTENEDNQQLLYENLENKVEENNSKRINVNPKVLIVDDTSINIFALRMLLSKLKVGSDSVIYIFYIYSNT